MSAAKVRKLIAQIDAMDGRHLLPKFAHRTTRTEEDFLLRLVQRKKGTRVLRHGWPDFLLIGSEGAYAVEVKANAWDRLRTSQVDMFGTLDAMGMLIYVWSYDRPDRLVPWRKWPVSIPKRESTGKAPSYKRR